MKLLLWPPPDLLSCPSVQYTQPNSLHYRITIAIRSTELLICQARVEKMYLVTIDAQIVRYGINVIW